MNRIESRNVNDVAPKIMNAIEWPVVKSVIKIKSHTHKQTIHTQANERTFRVEPISHA